jgi:hypothetical protein
MEKIFKMDAQENYPSSNKDYRIKISKKSRNFNTTRTVEPYKSKSPEKNVSPLKGISIVDQEVKLPEITHSKYMRTDPSI